MLARIAEFLKTGGPVTLSAEDRENIKAAHQVILNHSRGKKTVYGINTGFGKLSNVRVSAADLETLQINLLRSHACGVGEPAPKDIVALMMYLKILNLARGYSGCSLAVVEKLIELLNKQVYPVIPERGSVGASGDLAPLAHMGLPLIGEGEIFHQNRRFEAIELVKKGFYQPIRLGPKDGLSLINGTQYSTALLAVSLLEARHLFYLGELAAALSVEAMLATDTSFHPAIQRVGRQRGQQRVAKHMRSLLRDSEIIQSHADCRKVQDPYSFRCIPQVLGAVLDTIEYTEDTLVAEITAVSDNPLVFPEENTILTGGNFHAESIGLAADYLTIALTEMGNLAERRIANLIDGSVSQLPPFLVESGGLNSGYMLPHVTVAALCAENRTLSHPASVETIPTSVNQEDHVSMAPNAGLKLRQIVQNLGQIVWIELLVAAQGIDFRRPLRCGTGTALGYKKVRELVPYYQADRLMYPDLNRTRDFYSDDEFFKSILIVIDETPRQI